MTRYISTSATQQLQVQLLAIKAYLFAEGRLHQPTCPAPSDTEQSGGMWCVASQSHCRNSRHRSWVLNCAPGAGSRLDEQALCGVPAVEDGAVHLGGWAAMSPRPSVARLIDSGSAKHSLCEALCSDEALQLVRGC